MFACKEGHLEVVSFLITEGANVNAKSNVCHDVLSRVLFVLWYRIISLTFPRILDYYSLPLHDENDMFITNFFPVK